MENFTIRTLSFLDIPAMHKAFLKAFSDYTLNFELTEDKFVKKFVEKLNLEFDLSAGAFVEKQMIGFIFTNVGLYNGYLTAYNGGSGVIPEYRGRNITVELYKFLLNLFKDANVQQCILEVLTYNKPAIKSYTKVGFQRNRLLRCYKLEFGEFNYSKVNPMVEVKLKLAPNWDLYQTFTEVRSSYLDQSHLLSKNMKNETLFEAYLNDNCVGYAIYQQDLGRISQFGVKKELRRRGIGSAMFSHLIKHSDTKFLTVLNIDDRDNSIKRFLKKIGFTNKINQYEMVCKL